MTNKKDSICLDISSLDDEQKRNVAKSLKKTVNQINNDLNNGEPDEEVAEE